MSNVSRLFESNSSDFSRLCLYNFLSINSSKQWKSIFSNWQSTGSACQTSSVNWIYFVRERSKINILQKLIDNFLCPLIFCMLLTPSHQAGSAGSHWHFTRSNVWRASKALSEFKGQSSHIKDGGKIGEMKLNQKSVDIQMTTLLLNCMFWSSQTFGEFKLMGQSITREWFRRKNCVLTCPSCEGGQNRSEPFKLKSLTGNTAWLGDHEAPIAAKLSHRVGRAINKSMTTADKWQLGNYGIGGHYYFHSDYFEDKYLPLQWFYPLGWENRSQTLIINLFDEEFLWSHSQILNVDFHPFECGWLHAAMSWVIFQSSSKDQTHPHPHYFNI